MSDRETQAREHYERNETLAMRLGLGALLRLVPVAPERIKQALADGDKHLNTIPLAVWDRAALGRGYHERERCPTCGQRKAWVASDWPYADLKATAHQEPWKHAPGLSLAERVSVLKHVALYHTDHLEATS